MRNACLFLLLLVVVGCDPKKESAPAPSSSSSSTAKATATASVAPAAAPKAAPEEDAILKVTKKWNDALAKRDAESLRSLYDDKVRLYTTNTDRAGAVKAKASAFGAAKDYTQSIGPVEVDLRDKNKPSASFEKTWTSNGKTSKVLARLKFAKQGADYRITEESDNPSDERRKKAAADARSCEASIIAVVGSVPRVTSFLNGPTNPGAGHASNGMRLEPSEENPAIVAVAIHENHADHLVTFGWYDVDTQSGVVKETMPGDEVVTADAAKVATMKTACKK